MMHVNRPVYRRVGILSKQLGQSDCHENVIGDERDAERKYISAVIVVNKKRDDAICYRSLIFVQPYIFSAQNSGHQNIVSIVVICASRFTQNLHPGSRQIISLLEKL